MKPEIKKRWIEALRSGKYNQGRGYLCKDDSFCCLGVLCELAMEDGVIPRSAPRRVRSGSSQVGGVVTYGGRGSDYMPPEEVYKWAGASRYELGISIKSFEQVREDSKDRLAPWTQADHVPSLSELNDVGCDFGLIADVIEDCF